MLLDLLLHRHKPFHSASNFISTEVFAADILILRRLKNIVAKFLRNLLKINLAANRWLATDRVVGRVVEDDMRQIFTTGLSGNRHITHVYDARAITIKAVDLAIGLSLSDPKGDHDCMAHRADRQEVA